MYWYYIQESSKKITEKKQVIFKKKPKEYVMIKFIKENSLNK